MGRGSQSALRTFRFDMRLESDQISNAMVGLGRLERPTSPLSGVRSNHLSYRPRMIRTTPERCTDHAIRKMRKRNEDGVLSRMSGPDWPLIIQ
jgi:hypothetical protein